ncbi:MAG: glutathione S-transferase [Variovorax sp.]
MLDIPDRSAPVLYSFRRCPFAMRARVALVASGQRCWLREVHLRDKPAELIAASAKATVPVLVLTEGGVIEESLEIMLWALGRHDPHHWLKPAMPEMRALIADCDGPFKRHLDGYKYGVGDDSRDPLAQRACGAEFLERLEERLTGTAHLFGDSAALADWAVMPFVRQFAQVDTAWFGTQPWPGLRRWLAGLTASALWRACMRKEAPWRPGDAPVPVVPGDVIVDASPASAQTQTPVAAAT